MNIKHFQKSLGLTKILALSETHTCCHVGFQTFPETHAVKFDTVIIITNSLLLCQGSFGLQISTLPRASPAAKIPFSRLNYSFQSHAQTKLCHYEVYFMTLFGPDSMDFFRSFFGIWKLV